MPVTIDVGDWFAELGQISGSHAVSDPITRRRNSVFGHIARLSEDTPAHQALQVSCRSDSRPSSRPKLEASPRSSQQPMDWPAMRRDNNNTPPADLWRRSTTRGHSGVTLRSSTTTRWRLRHAVLALVHLDAQPETDSVGNAWSHYKVWRRNKYNNNSPLFKSVIVHWLPLTLKVYFSTYLEINGSLLVRILYLYF